MVVYSPTLARFACPPTPHACPPSVDCATRSPTMASPSSLWCDSSAGATGHGAQHHSDVLKAQVFNTEKLTPSVVHGEGHCIGSPQRCNCSLEE
ncbi:hypothetical protein BDA96_05G148500 [Sorghum bicolor]|uniref:Uncharacterized protein n=2 Tax=Sorghum bicolor TaxID=4558 RepID=A0A921QXE6_SORBI|nr:hypothetical protein BDA96_05G148500 [Sorghum bicolor]OQU83560.1 hypothetical protein SORBI_3005G133750 [Sorghum bicolor]